MTYIQADIHMRTQHRIGFSDSADYRNGYQLPFSKSQNVTFEYGGKQMFFQEDFYNGCKCCIAGLRPGLRYPGKFFKVFLDRKSVV